MAEKIYHPGENYQYPLIIKKLLATPLRDSPDREIVYSDRHRYTYKDLKNKPFVIAGQRPMKQSHKSRGKISNLSP
jgi:hypothetical protein